MREELRPSSFAAGLRRPGLVGDGKRLRCEVLLKPELSPPGSACV